MPLACSSQGRLEEPKPRSVGQVSPATSRRQRHPELRGLHQPWRLVSFTLIPHSHAFLASMIYPVIATRPPNVLYQSMRLAAGLCGDDQKQYWQGRRCLLLCLADQLSSSRLVFRFLSNTSTKDRSIPERKSKGPSSTPSSRASDDSKVAFALVGRHSPPPRPADDA